MTQPPAPRLPNGQIRPLEEMIEKWNLAAKGLGRYGQNDYEAGKERSFEACADELASALPEMERLIGERVAAAEEAAHKEFYEPLRTANSMLMDLRDLCGEENENYRSLGHHLLGLTVLAEQSPQYAGTGALARHDRELKKRVLESAKQIFGEAHPAQEIFRRALGGSE